MLPAAELVAFVPSSDLGRSRHFYESVLGFTVTHADDFAVVLDANGIRVRITDVGPFTPQTFTILGWHVNDLQSTVAKLTAQGVTFLAVDGLTQDDLGIWTNPSGTTVAWFKDPDNNTLSVTADQP